MYIHVINVYKQIYCTSGAWHDVLSEFPHSTISRTLCRMLCAFSKFHLAFSPVLSGRFFCRRSRRLIAFWCNSGSSDSDIPTWRVAIFQSMHWMSTSTISLLGSATWGKLASVDPALALSIALLMSKTWHIHVYTQYNTVYTIYSQVYTCTSGAMRSLTMKGIVSISIFMRSPVILAPSLPSM